MDVAAAAAPSPEMDAAAVAAPPPAMDVVAVAAAPPALDATAAAAPAPALGWAARLSQRHEALSQKHLLKQESLSQRHVLVASQRHTLTTAAAAAAKAKRGAFGKLLQGSPLAALLRPDEVDRALAAMTEVRRRRGDVVCEAGAAPEGVWILVGGECHVVSRCAAAPVEDGAPAFQARWRRGPRAGVSAAVRPCAAINLAAVLARRPSRETVRVSSTAADFLVLPAATLLGLIELRDEDAADAGDDVAGVAAVVAEDERRAARHRAAAAGAVQACARLAARAVNDKEAQLGGGSTSAQAHRSATLAAAAQAHEAARYARQAAPEALADWLSGAARPAAAAVSDWRGLPLLCDGRWGRVVGPAPSPAASQWFEVAFDEAPPSSAAVFVPQTPCPQHLDGKAARPMSPRGLDVWALRNSLGDDGPLHHLLRASLGASSPHNSPRASPSPAPSRAATAEAVAGWARAAARSDDARRSDDAPDSGAGRVAEHGAEHGGRHGAAGFFAFAVASDGGARPRPSTAPAARRYYAEPAAAARPATALRWGARGRPETRPNTPHAAFHGPATSARGRATPSDDGAADRCAAATPTPPCGGRSRSVRAQSLPSSGGRAQSFRAGSGRSLLATPSVSPAAQQPAKGATPPAMPPAWTAPMGIRSMRIVAKPAAAAAVAAAAAAASADPHAAASPVAVVASRPTTASAIRPTGAIRPTSVIRPTSARLSSAVRPTSAIRPTSAQRPTTAPWLATAKFLVLGPAATAGAARDAWRPRSVSRSLAQPPRPASGRPPSTVSPAGSVAPGAAAAAAAAAAGRAASGLRVYISGASARPDGPRHAGSAPPTRDPAERPRAERRASLRRPESSHLATPSTSTASKPARAVTILPFGDRRPDDAL